MVRRDHPMKNTSLSSTCLALVALAMTAVSSPVAAIERVVSPSGEVVVTFDLASDGSPTIAIDYLGKPLVLTTHLALAPELPNGFTQTAATTVAHDFTWESPVGERRRVPDRHRELSIELRHRSGGTVRLAIRAYDEGAAFRAALPDETPRRFAASAKPTEFGFPAGTQAWAQTSGYHSATRQSAAALPAGTPLPLTMELADGRFAALATLPESTWTYLLVGRTPGELIERNYLRLNLASPMALTDTAWIKPGRVLRGFAPTKVGAEAAADYAVSAGLSYLSLTRGWSESGLDVAALVTYARARALGVFLHLENSQLESGLETTLRQFAQWGVKGVEIARIDAGPAGHAAWVASIAQLAAGYRLLVAVPDQAMPAEFSRTWPNVFAVGVAPVSGQTDAAPWNCLLPVTTGLFAPLPSTALRSAGVSRAHRLALSLITADPFPTVDWSERPLPAEHHRAMEFFQRVPALRLDTKVLSAELGRHLAITRRIADDWFVGVINGTEAHSLSLPLGFLDDAREYIAHIYTDDSVPPSRRNEAYAFRRVFSKDTLDLGLAARGGVALWITPALKRR